MSRSLALLMSLACPLAAGQALAHHSIAAHFDESERVTVTGTLTKLDWRNPHISFAVETEDAQGGVQTWRAEGFPPNWFIRHHISKAEFERAIGRTVTVVLAPARDGSAYGTLWLITFPDGSVVALRNLR